MAKRVIIQDAPSLIQKPEVRLIKSDFEAAIWKHGYDIYHDKMVKCPCSSDIGQPLVTCRNCIGSGWVLVERVQTRMMLQAINLDTKIKDWSEQKVGTIKITCLEKDKISFMDRIIVLKGVATSNELLKIRSVLDGGVTVKFAYTIYEILSVFDIYLYDGDGNVLRALLSSIDYSIESNRVILSSNFNSIDDIRISIKYKYRPQFHVIDISRDTIVQDSKADTGDWTYNEQFPVYAIGRRTHYVLDTQNYDDTLVLNNVGEQVEESLYDIRLRPSLYGTGDPPSPVGLEDGVIYYRYIN